MKKLKNENIKKEQNLMIRNIVIFFIILIISFACKLWEIQINKKADSEITDLETIINQGTNNDDKRAYLHINVEPFKFATSDGSNRSYYIVTAENYLYIAYMNDTEYEKIKNDENLVNSITIDGVTSIIPDDIKNIEIEVYNEGLEDEYKIDDDSKFYSYFGNVYLDTTTKETSNAFLAKCLFIILAAIGGIGIVIATYRYISFNKAMEKMDSIKFKELEEEINKPDAFYYEKAHLYLTDKYIVNFNGKFVVLDYNDIIWAYTYEQRRNGIKTLQAIKVMNKEGKTYLIATMSGWTKAEKETYNEIWNTITSKNTNMLVGYTKENIKEIKERRKNKNL